MLTRRPIRRMLYILTVLVIGIFGLVLRGALLTRNSARLITLSEAFPRDYTVGNPSDPRIEYVALGDSIVQGVGAPSHEGTLTYKIAGQLAAAGNLVHVTNLGISGAKIQDVLTNQVPRIAGKPNVITVVVGANDASHGTPLNEYDETLRKLITQLQADRILFATSPDFRPTPALIWPSNILPTKRAIAQNQLLTEALTNTSVQTVHLFDDGKLRGRSYYAADQFHPNDTGYSRWADLFTR